MAGEKHSRDWKVDPLCPIFPLCLDPFCLGASTKEIKGKSSGLSYFFRYCWVSVPAGSARAGFHCIFWYRIQTRCIKFWSSILNASSDAPAHSLIRSGTSYTLGHSHIWLFRSNPSDPPKQIRRLDHVLMDSVSVLLYMSPSPRANSKQNPLFIYNGLMILFNSIVSMWLYYIILSTLSI